jgi:DNA-binding winged helix-turn-helix (wHTH) protein
VDLECGSLRRGGEEISLRAKSFEVLTYLVERHGRLVTKAELDRLRLAGRFGSR